jgi:hypothetical protein
MSQRHAVEIFAKQVAWETNLLVVSYNTLQQFD